MASTCSSHPLTSASSRFSAFPIRPYDIALCFDAFAFTFVPSSDTCPSFTSPASRHSASTCRNSPARASRCRLRKSLMVRKSGR